MKNKPEWQKHKRFIEQLEDKTLAAAEFTHLAHIRAAWYYLNQFSWAQASQNCCQSIKSFAESLGAKNKYNQTVSIAMLKLIQQRLKKMEPTKRTDWEFFISNNQDLIKDGLDILLGYYDESVLFSEPARSTFVPPIKDFDF